MAGVIMCKGGCGAMQQWCKRYLAKPKQLKQKYFRSFPGGEESCAFFTPASDWYIHLARVRKGRKIC